MQFSVFMGQSFSSTDQPKTVSQVIHPFDYSKPELKQIRSAQERIFSQLCSCKQQFARLESALRASKLRLNKSSAILLFLYKRHLGILQHEHKQLQKKEISYFHVRLERMTERRIRLLGMFNHLSCEYRRTQEEKTCFLRQKEYESLPKTIWKTQQHEMNAYLQYMNVKHHFHGVVLVRKGSKIMWKAGYGFRNGVCSNDCSRNTIDTKFCVKSMELMLMAYEIMSLQKKGVCNFDDEINLYLSDSLKDPLSKGITIRQALLSIHQSPSSQSTYKWLTQIIDHLTTESNYQEAMKAVFFRLGLKNTFFYYNPEIDACGRCWKKESDRMKDLETSYRGHMIQGFVSNLEDLERFDRVLSQETGITQNFFAEWESESLGFNAYMKRNVETKDVCIVLSNVSRDTASAKEIALFLESVISPFSG